jgi:hypothetical protein
MVCSICSAALAVPITLFTDTDLFIARAQDIIVAECISPPQGEPMRPHGLQAVDVNTLKVLKGIRSLGSLRIATTYPMKPHTTYMLYSLGGNALGTDLLALPELSVVPLPAMFRLDELKDKGIKEQVQYLLSRRLFEVERELAPLLQEKALLEKAVSDSRSEWYESHGPVTLGPITERRPHTAATHQTWLDLGDKKLQCSQSTAGNSGYFCFEKMDAPPWTPYWEFSPCVATKIEDLVGKPLRAKFYGLYTPGRGETALGWTGLQAIHVAVGQVLLARAVDEPRTIFVIQIEKQAQDKEQMSARYAVIHD